MSGRYRRFLAGGGGAFTMISNRVYIQTISQYTDAVQSTQLQNKNTINACSSSYDWQSRK